MLVLSRRPGQRILFPELNISIEVAQVKGNNIRLGIDAPADVRILREELITKHTRAAENAAEKAWTHELRGRLNTAVVALYVVEKQLQTGMARDAEAMLRKALQDLQALDQSLASVGETDKVAAPTRNAIQALLVEDNRAEEVLLASYLRLNGIKVETAHDGYEALEFLSSHDRPDFMLLDMRMPRFDGPSTLSAIRRNPRLSDLKIFGVTGSSPEELGIPTGPEGVDGWFLKPFNPAHIVEAMKAARRN